MCIGLLVEENIQNNFPWNDQLTLAGVTHAMVTYDKREEGRASLGRKGGRGVFSENGIINHSHLLVSEVQEYSMAHSILGA